MVKTLEYIIYLNELSPYFYPYRILFFYIKIKMILLNLYLYNLVDLLGLAVVGSSTLVPVLGSTSHISQILIKLIKIII